MGRILIMRAATVIRTPINTEHLVTNFFFTSKAPMETKIKQLK